MVGTSAQNWMVRLSSLVNGRCLEFRAEARHGPNGLDDH
jgi:hypothetical protein